MKRYSFLALLVIFSNASQGKSMRDFYSMNTTDIEGKKVSLDQYRGKVALVVNTASECGYTSQYQGLEALYQKYKGKGLVVLGFPSNDFGGQEPGSNAEIKKFCEAKFKVSFPMFEKSIVSGNQKQPVYDFLVKNSEPLAEVKWNFEKFIVNRQGVIKNRFLSRVTPDSSELTQAIESALASK